MLTKSPYIIGFCLVFTLLSWGFFGHRTIAEWGIYALPDPLFEVYHPHQTYLIERSVFPDVRKNADPDEYCRHYIDLEHWDTVDLSVNYADTCLKEGTLPWVILKQYKALVYSFRSQNAHAVLRYSGDLAHYASDLCVPLHTTENYDGQLTSQEGIHALWETHLLEQNDWKYQYYGIHADTIKFLDRRIKAELEHSHGLVTTLLDVHSKTKQTLKDDTYGYFERKGRRKEGYSQIFMDAYEQKIGSMIEDQLRRSVQLTTDLWFSAWIESNVSDLEFLKSQFLNSETDKMISPLGGVNPRNHE
ncbi:MAG: zinc dependent phospholipase C family protein [Flavobacteriales bacterium]